VGFLVVSIVLIIQGLLFADGGLSALGLNIINMGLIGAVGGYLVYRVMFRLSGLRPGRVAVVAAVAAFVSVPMAALGFVLEFAFGGTIESLSVGTILIAMVTTHLLIGIGEGVITFFVIGAVMKSRPDLVYGSPTFAGHRSEELST